MKFSIDQYNDLAEEVDGLARVLIGDVGWNRDDFLLSLFAYWFRTYPYEIEIREKRCKVTASL